MRRFCLRHLGSVRCQLAESHWIQFRSGPFEVYTDADRDIRPGSCWGGSTNFAMCSGYMLGNQDLQTRAAHPHSAFQERQGARRLSVHPAVLDGRDRWCILLAAGAPIPPEVYRECTRLLLESNTGRMPAAYEHGLIAAVFHHRSARHAYYAGRAATGRTSAIAIGRACNLLATNPDYYGKLRILLFNLQKGVDEAPAYSNAFGKSRAEIEKEVDQHISPPEISRRRRCPARRSTSSAIIKEQPLRRKTCGWRWPICCWITARARAYRGADSRKHAYVAEAYEGLGRDGAARQAGRRSAPRFRRSRQRRELRRSDLSEYARLEPDSAKAVAALQQAAALPSKVSKVKLAPLYSLMAPARDRPRQAFAVSEAGGRVWRRAMPTSGKRWPKAISSERISWKPRKPGTPPSWPPPPTSSARAWPRAAPPWKRSAWIRKPPSASAWPPKKPRARPETQRAGAGELARRRSQGQSGECIGRAAPAKVEAWWDGPKPDGARHRHFEARGMHRQAGPAGPRRRRSQTHSPAAARSFESRDSRRRQRRRSAVVRRSRAAWPSNISPSPTRNPAPSEKWPRLNSNSPAAARATLGGGRDISFCLPPSTIWTGRRWPRLRPLVRAELHLSNADYG